MDSNQPRMTIPTSSRQDPRYALYYAALDADAAWHDLLVKEFGSKAGNARYDQRGVSTPELKAAAQAYRKAIDAHLEDMRGK